MSTKEDCVKSHHKGSKITRRDMLASIAGATVATVAGMAVPGAAGSGRSASAPGRMARWLLGHWSEVAVWLMIVAYIAFFGTVTVLKHQAFQTTAFDLGNVDQAVWNTQQGRPLAMTNIEGLTNRLGTHVEPILLPISVSLALNCRLDYRRESLATEDEHTALVVFHFHLLKHRQDKVPFVPRLKAPAIGHN